MMEKLLTISVAAYNVEQFLPKLFDSLTPSKWLGQLEILIINDGSKDNTLEVAEEYQTQYPNSIFVVDKPNGGHGSTINAGISHAHGKYFKVVDGDDWVDTKNLDYVLEQLESRDDDLVLTDFYNCYEHSDNKEVFKVCELVPGKSYALEDAVLCMERLLMHSVFYKTSILKHHDIRIDEHTFYVDSEYVVYPLKYVQTVSYFDVPVYCYRIGDVNQSMSLKSLQKNIDQHIFVSKQLIAFYNRNEYTKAVDSFICKTITYVNLKTLQVLLSFSASLKNYRLTKDFDTYIQKEFPEGKSHMGSRLIKLYRANRFLFYPIISILMRRKMLSANW